MPGYAKTCCYRHGWRRMNINAFDPVNTPLNKGISLIEASAGTGKTYTIAMLVLRLVVEADIPIDKILVVTFTKAATEELKDRIRSRLADAKRLLAGIRDIRDNTIETWLEQSNVPPDTIKQRLDLALIDIDQAGILTIHGFCQRVLKEHALSSGQLFDAELTEDLAIIKQTCADDFWRRNIQNRPSWEASVLTKDFVTPGQLLESIAFIAENAIIYPGHKKLDDVLLELKQAAAAANASLMDCRQKAGAYFGGQQFKAGYQEKFASKIDLLSSWLNGDTLQFPDPEALSLLTYEGLLEGLNGTQFKSNKTQTSEQRKIGFIAEMAVDTRPFDILVAKSQEITAMLRRNLAETIRSELDAQLEQLNAWSFDNLIAHLAKALQSEHSQFLSGELRQRFKAALIDEFQDTDTSQWRIFSGIFAVNSHYLFLVGDPKQAIYKFRGADIYSYLEAQSQAHYRYTLDRNWRSHPQLVAAVNRLFQREDVFRLPGIVFHATQPALSGQDGALIRQNINCAPMMLWQLPESGGKTGYWQPNRNDAAQIIRLAVVNEIVELLSGSYTLQFQPEQENRTLLPQDIAILVRTNQQAKDYHEALRQASVPSVLNNTESVFTSEEAAHLHTLLQAVAHPGAIRLLGQALALSWFGHNGQTLHKLLDNESEIDAVQSRFLGYYQLWRQHGVMTMMQSLFKQEAIARTLSKSTLAERRLTNLQHILELLQQAVIDGHLGVHKTLNWLKSAITKAVSQPASNDSQQLRLESDADAVRLITMHRAKGLEYPIVFCPYLWQSNRRGNSKKPLVQCHLPDDDTTQTSRLIADLGSEYYDRHHEQARFEEQAEEIRLAYVALTRAKYRCYAAWADVRTEDKPNGSALAWLFDFSGQDFSGQQNVLQKLQAENPNAFAYRLLEATGGIDACYQQPDSFINLAAKKRLRPLYTGWRMASYTALSALSLADSPELPEDKADEVYTHAEGLTVSLPVGAQTGNVVHELLENVAFADLAHTADISDLRDRLCLRYGLKLEQPGMIDDLLHKTVTTPLSAKDNRFCLMNIPDNRCLKEMPFYLSMPLFNTRKLNETLSNQPAFQALTHKQLHGYLTGFIDLICEYEERFYVIDYKTNNLPDYTNAALLQAMREHNYGLQYWIYSVVLHRYLQQRLPGYRFKDHFGGVRYLFVRGMTPGIPMSGVFEDNPDLSVIEALSSLFGN